MDRIRALIVDDKKITGELFGYILGREGHDVKIVQDIEDALNLIRQNEVDIAFLDIIMPRHDGIEVLKEIKKFAPNFPVVMMSGYTVEEKREEIRELGAVTCLDKPIKMEAVREVVKLALGKEI